MKKQTYFIILLALFFGFSQTQLLANTFQASQNVTISSEVTENLYLAGGNILIDAPIRADLICAGGEVIIQDTIEEDLILAGGTLKIMGYIGDDVRVAGGTIIITKDIYGDLIIAGGEVTVGEDVNIFGDLQVAGGKLTMNGTAKGNVNLRGGEIIWNGTAEREFKAKTGTLTLNGTLMGTSNLSAQKILLGDNAIISNDVEYWTSNGEMDFGAALTGNATANFNTDLKGWVREMDGRSSGFGIVAFWIYRLLAAAVLIALFIWLFHRFFSKSSEEASKNFASHLGYGALYAIGLPVLIAITFMTIIGIPVSIVLMMGYGLTIALGHILAAVLIAYGWNFYYHKEWNRRTLFFVAVLSYLILKFIGAIPLIGFLISLLVVMTAFGTVLYIWRENRLSRRTAIGH